MITYDLSARGDETIYAYLYACIRRDIETGAIAADRRLPSKRALASHLGVSVITVEAAYRQLVAEGYVRSVERRGFFANPISFASPLRRPNVKAADAATLDVEPRRVAVATDAPSGTKVAFDLSSSTPAAGMFPFKAWSRCVRQALSQASEEELLLQSAGQGSLRLRRAIAAHLRAFRGMDVDSQCIVIGAGSQTLYQLIVQLLGRSLRFAVEDPGYPRLTQIYRANDVDVAHVPLEPDGIDLDVLAASRAQVAHVMPSHQYPTGCVTSVAKRYGLLAWALQGQDGSCQSQRWVVEDDYDSEFRLSGRPIPSLASIDAAGRVIYLNTFAKTLGPGFRMSYVVLPEGLAERYRDQLGFYSCTVSAIDQLALALFIEDGSYERHINRMRTLYRGVAEALVAAVRETSLGEVAAFEHVDAGLHFVLRLPERTPTGPFCEEAAARGVRIQPLSAFRQMPAADDAPYAQGGFDARFLVNFSGLLPRQAPEVARALGQAWERVCAISG